MDELRAAGAVYVYGTDLGGAFVRVHAVTTPPARRSFDRIEDVRVFVGDIEMKPPGFDLFVAPEVVLPYGLIGIRPQRWPLRGFWATVQITEG